MADTKTPLEVGGFYHIYNHAVGDEQLFVSDKNYLHFLGLFNKYLTGFVDVYAYCLMPNHFHFIIQVNDLSEILLDDSISKATSIDVNNMPLIISRQFSHLFNSYAQGYNKQHNRKGSLFANRYKRKLITTESYLSKLIHYVHYNPVKANLCTKISYWQYSSYNAILSDKKTRIKRENVVDLFGDKRNFIFCHNIEPSLSGIE